MFYDEEALIAQAIQNSLLQTNGIENNVSCSLLKDALYNKALEEALVSSKKHFDEIKRKKQE